MPAGMPGMLDLARATNNDTTIGLIEEAYENCPEFALFPSRQVAETSYKTLIRVGYPVSAFRRGNEGAARSKSQFANRLTECFIIDSPIAADKMIADAWQPDGAAGWQAIETGGVVESTSRRVASSVYYGNSALSVAAGVGDAKGFPGFVDVYDVSNHQIDAGGTTALTSIWLVKLGIKDVHFVLGGNTVLTTLPQWRIETAYDVDGKPFTAYMNNLAGWIGLNVSSINSLVRIKNVGTDNVAVGNVGKGATDYLIQSGFELFPANQVPDYIIMNRRSRKQIRQSRTNVATGQGFSANSIPMPTETDGIPYLITDALVNNETF